MSSKPIKVISFFISVYVLFFIYLGFFDFPLADDYAFLNTLKDNGFWIAQNVWWQSGGIARFTNTFYMNLISAADFVGLYFETYRIIPLLMILLSYASIYFCFTSIFPNSEGRKAFFISLCLQGLWLNQMSGLNDSLYWLAGTPYYITCCVILFATGFAAKLLREKNILVNMASLSLLAFLNSGLIEIGAIFLLIELLSIILFCIYNKNFKQVKLLLLPFFSCLLGLCVVYYAPGTVSRFYAISEMFGRDTRSFWVTVKMTLIGGIPFAIDSLLSPLKYSLLLLLPDLLPYVEKNVVFSNPLEGRLKIRHAIGLTIIGAFCFQAITAYAFASPLPPRGEATASWALWFCWILFFVFLYRDRQYLLRIKDTSLFRWRFFLIFICFLLSFNTRDVIPSLLDANGHYSRQTYRRSLILETPKGEISYVPLIPVKNKLLYLEDDIGHKNGVDDGSSWGNAVIAEYYGVKYIYGIPKILFDKGMRSEFTNEEYIESLILAAEAGDAHSAFSLARIYDVGRLGVKQDVKKAAEYYAEAYNGGESLAMRSLFRIYLMDKRVEADYLKSVQYGLKYLFNRYVARNVG